MGIRSSARDKDNTKLYIHKRTKGTTTKNSHSQLNKTQCTKANFVHPLLLLTFTLRSSSATRFSADSLELADIALPFSSESVAMGANVPRTPMNLHRTGHTYYAGGGGGFVWNGNVDGDRTKKRNI